MLFFSSVACVFVLCVMCFCVLQCCVPRAAHLALVSYGLRGPVGLNRVHWPEWSRRAHWPHGADGQRTVGNAGAGGGHTGAWTRVENVVPTRRRDAYDARALSGALVARRERDP